MLALRVSQDGVSIVGPPGVLRKVGRAVQAIQFERAGAVSPSAERNTPHAVRGRTVIGSLLL